MSGQRLSRRSVVRGIVGTGSILALGPLLTACGGGTTTQPTVAPAAAPAATATTASAALAAAATSSGEDKGKFVVVSLRTLQQGRGIAKLEDDFVKAHPGVEIA